jgi:hypothetical protein
MKRHLRIFFTIAAYHATKAALLAWRGALLRHISDNEHRRRLGRCEKSSGGVC